MVATFYIIKPKYNEEERNEKIKVSKNVFIATIVIQLAKCFISGFTVYDLLASITFSIIAVVFYKIFVNSLVVFQDIREKRAFSIEEVIGASLVLSIAISSFYSINIFGFNICNILSIFIVLLLGWKQGILVGTTSGVTIGVTLGIITGSEPIMIAAYAISGMVAGILNKFGKIGVIVGFCLGNIILAYVSNGYTIELIHFKEILVASIGLFLVPKNININIEDVIGKSKLLPVAPDRALDNSEKTAEKLNNVSKTIQKMADTFKEENNRSAENKINSTSNKQIFVTELLDNMEPYKDNLLYDDINDIDGKIVNDIFEKVIDKQEITKADLLRIFAVNNSYVQDISNSDIEQVVRSINTAYKISKSNFVWQKKFEENNKNIETQLNGVSKAISGIAESIQKEFETDKRFEKERQEIIYRLEQHEVKIDDVYIRKPDRYFIEIYLNKDQESFSVPITQKILTQVLEEDIIYNEETSIGSKISFMSDDKFVMALGIGTKCKANNEISGDSILNIRLKDGKYLIAISDGMGAGQEAKNSSLQALKMLENLLISGFDSRQSIDLINSSLLNNSQEIFATLDIAIIDLYKGNIEFIKSGACPTYIKNNKKVQLVKSNTLPTGILQNADLQIYDRDIFDRDIILMCTDGVVDSNVEYKNKELWIKYVLEDLDTSNTSKIADLILNEAIDNNYGIAKDDMSVVTCKFLAK
ncbi:MAG: SpoIIE family protein phosphatase [Clostridia bacterium]|nr:SpoIIE family protein phosphatase [Clostridia bacterium]